MSWQREASALGAVLAESIVRVLLHNDRGNNALDLACGDGLLTKEISKRFKRVVAVEASCYHVEVARQRVPEAEFHVALIGDFDTGGELFDRIYMFSILEHLENPVEVLGKVKHWLSKDGFIVACVPNALSLNRRIGQKMGLIKDCYELTKQDIEVGHKKLYDPEMLGDEIVKAGLIPSAMGGILLKPFSNTQMEWFIKSWSEIDADPDWRTKLCGALCEMGNELAWYANAIWARCANPEKDM